MANGYNPYSTATTQQALLESLLGAQQSSRMSDVAIGTHKSKLLDRFQRESIAAQKEQERILNRSRGSNILDKVISGVAGYFGGPLAGGIASGLTGMLTASDQSKFEREKIEKARDAGLGSGWEGTFLGKQARDISTETDTILDKMKADTKLSGLDLLTTGVTEGIKGFSMGKLTEGIKESIDTAKLAKGLTKEQIEALGVKDVTADTLIKDKLFKDKFTEDELTNLIKSGTKFTEADAPILKALFEGFGQDPSTLLGGDKDSDKKGNILKNLLMFLGGI